MRTSRRKPFWIHSRPRNAVEPSLALQIASVVHCFPSVPVFQWLLVSYVFLLCILNILIVFLCIFLLPSWFRPWEFSQKSFRNSLGIRLPETSRPSPGKALFGQKGQGTEKNSAVPKPRSGKAAKNPLTRPGSADSKMLFIRKWLSTWLLQSHMYAIVYICIHMSHVEYVKSKRTSKQWNRAALQLYLNLMNILNIIIKLYIKLSSVEKESK